MTVVKKYWIDLCLVLLCFVSCRPLSPVSIQKVVADSGNEKELHKAIAYFRKEEDQRKLKALYFLIENMPYQRHQEGESVEDYNFLFGILCETPDSRKEWLEVIWDSIATVHHRVGLSNFQEVEDIHTLKADFLIQHIESAFQAWNQPWSKELNFLEFCQYILPYKLLEETPEAWMGQVAKDYATMTIPSGDVYDACLEVNKKLKKEFKIRTLPTVGDVTYSQLDRIRSGKCDHATQYTTYVMRTFGIPMAMDYTYWGNLNGGHSWNALIYHGKPIPFVGSESDPGKTKIDQARQRKRAKVFRHTYAAQRNELRYLASEDESIPPVLNDYRIQDVTKDYIPVQDVRIQLDTAIRKSLVSDYLYLSIFNRQEWMPIYWGKSTAGHVVFPNMGRSVLYLPVAYRYGSIEPVASPVLVHQDGKIETITAHPSSKENIVLKRKSPEGPSIIAGNEYELCYWDNAWKSLGKQTATTDSLMYDNVPEHALLWVMSDDKSTSERPFLYRNGGQEWW